MLGDELIFSSSPGKAFVTISWPNSQHYFGHSRSRYILSLEHLYLPSAHYDVSSLLMADVLL